LPVDAGAPDTPRGEAEALLGELPPARAALPARACPPQVLGRRRRARAERRLGLADRGLARARAVRPDGNRLHGPSEPQPNPDGRRLGGTSAAQGLPDRRGAGPLLGRPMTIAPEQRVTRDWPIVAPPPYEGSRIPSPIPTVLPLPEALAQSEDVLRINFGPNHPSTHGVLRLIVDLDGEQVVGLSAVIGYLHTGFEKTMEHKTWWKCIT